MSLKSILKRPVFVLVFIVLFIVFAFVGKFGLSSQAETAPHAAMFVPAITATNVDALFTDVDGDGRADPGDTIEYTVTINNTAAAGAGNDALNLQFNETLHANTTLVGGSVVASPIAANDSFSSIGNVGISVPLANGVFANDINPVGTLTVQSTNTAGLQGTLSLNTSTGAFDFTPNPGFEGSTTFTYTLANGSGFTSTATVTINVSGMIWFVNANAGVNGDGRLGAPFNSLANFNAGAADDATDNIFLFESANPYTGGITLLSGQKLIGQDATATLAAIAGVTVPSFSSPVLPVMNSANGTVTNLTSTMTLVASTTLRGFSVNTTTTTGISGGAVTSVTTSELRVTTTTGTAVSLSGTGGTLSFTSISSNGAANGISLTNTTGNFTVTGDGGTCSVATPTCTGGRIQNTVGADGATAGIGVRLQNANAVSLTRMRIDNHPNFGIRGLSVSGFTLDTSLIDGTHGAVAVAANDEGAISFTNLLGSAAITNSTVANTTSGSGAETVLRVINNSGTLDRLTISGSTIFNSNSVAGTGDDGMYFESQNSAVMRLTVNNSHFTAARADLIQTNALNSSTMDIVVTNSEFRNNNAAILSGGGGTLFSGGGTGSTATVTFNISGNTFRDSRGHALGVFKGTGTSNFTGTISNNTVGVAGVPNSGTADGASDISAESLGAGTMTVLISGNTLRQYNEAGIRLFANTGSSVLNATVIGNTVTEPAAFAFGGVYAGVGGVAGDTATVNLLLGSFGTPGNQNSLEDGNVGTTDVFLDEQTAAATFNLSRGGSVAGTVTGVVQDDNVGNPTVGTSGTITLVAGSPPTPFAPEFEGENKAATSFDNILSFSKASYQTSSYLLASSQPLLKHSCNTETVSRKEIVKAEATVVETRETAGSNYLATVAAFYNASSRFVGAAVGKLDSLITPTVMAEETSNISSALFSGETINVGAPTGFTLPASKSITIKFRATVNNTPIGLAQISTQGTVSGSNFANVLTDDTAVGGGADPTATLIDSTTVTVSSLQNPSLTGQSVTFTATLTGAPVHGAGNPGGTVQFFDNGVAVGAPVAAVAGAVNTSTAQFVTSSLTAGNHPITATYGGGAGFNANNTANTVNQSVSNTAVWDGSTSTAWTDGTNWTTNAAPSLATNDVSIPAAGVTNNPTISAAGVTVNNLTLSTGRTLTVNIILTVSGTLTNNGTIMGTGTIANNFSNAGTLAPGLSPGILNVTGTFANTGAVNMEIGGTGGAGVNPNGHDQLVVSGAATLAGTLNVTLTNGFNPASLNEFKLIDAATLSGTFATVNLPNIAPLVWNLRYVPASGDVFLGVLGQPTEAKVADYKVYRFDDEQRGNLVRWQTSFEVRNLGFLVYRWRVAECGRPAAKVAPSPQCLAPVAPGLIAGSAFMAGAQTALTAGHSYSWWDAGAAPDSVYWLEDIDLNGTRTLHGPFTPDTDAGPQEQKLRSALLDQLRPACGANCGVIEHRGPAEAASAARPVAPNPVANRVAVKFPIRQAGWYRVTAQQLAAAGWNVNTRHDLLQLYLGGVTPVPLSVTAFGDTLGTKGYIEFYARGQDTRETDSQTYWLVNRETPGLRLGPPARVAPGQSPDATGSKQETATPSGFAYTVERKERFLYFAALTNGEDAENFFGAAITNQPGNQTIRLNKVDTSAPATLSVALQGATAGEHRIAVSLNGQVLPEISFAGLMPHTARLNVSPDILREGDNQITLRSLNGNADVSLTDALRIAYAHRYEAEDDQLRFTAPRRNTSVGGFTSPRIRVFDVTDESKTFEVAALVQTEATGYSATPLGAFNGRTLYAVTENRTLMPSAITLNEPSNWTDESRAADFIILTHPRFRAAVEPLAAARRAAGLRTEVITTTDIYDEWGGGEKNTQAISAFLRWSHEHWATAPRYLLLVGDASYDPRNYLGFGESDFLPTRYTATTQVETASDETYVDFDGDGVGELAIGRLPVREAAQASLMVQKTLNYTPRLADGALLVADQADDFDFAGLNLRTSRQLPPALPVTLINRGGSDPETRQAIIARWNQGPALVQYAGHGSVEVWTGAPLFNSADAANLTNGARLPIAVTLTCLNGYFHDLNTESLAETLLKNANGGAVAVWSSSALTPPPGQAEMGLEFARLLYATPGARLGDSVRQAKAATQDPEVRRTWTLFGDPTLPVR